MLGFLFFPLLCPKIFVSDEDIPIPYSRNWNDSLKINRKRSREEKERLKKSIDD